MGIGGDRKYDGSVESMTEAMHHDEGKLRWDLAPWQAFRGVIEVLTHGIKKYAERNWEGGMRYSRLFASCMRHMLEWWLRNDIDESGLNHLKHAMANLSMLVTYIEKGMTQFDDRPRFDAHTGISKESENGSRPDRDDACAHDSYVAEAGGWYCKRCGKPVRAGVDRFTGCVHRGHRTIGKAGQWSCDDCGEDIYSYI